tara:strand:- start:587 stop:1426 length:840 start_codon:yes stop_codon:yes gene_type:complete
MKLSHLTIIILLILTFSCSNNSDLDNNNLSILVISSDHSLGNNKFRFALLDSNGKLVKEKLKDVIIKNLNSNELQKIDPVYEEWFTGKGAYYSEIIFNEFGNFEVKSIRKDNSFGTALFQVNREPLTPKIGSAPPVINTKTAKSIEDIKYISSDPNPNSNFYSISYIDAIKNELPTIVIFSTPALCVSGTCGPLLDHIKEISTNYPNCNYIHIEVYENFIGKNLNDIDTLTVTEPTKSWGLPTEPWIFFLDKKGILKYKLEGFAKYNELLKLTQELILN